MNMAATSRKLARTALLLAGAMTLVVAPVSMCRAAEPHPFEITPFGGYRFGGRLEVLLGRLVMSDAPVFGGVLGYRVAPDALLEFTYVQENTDFTFEPTASGDNVFVTDLAIRSFYIGGVYEHGLSQVRPYAGMSIGMSRFDPELESAAAETRFSFHFMGGLRTDFSQAVGLKWGVRGIFSTPPDDGSVILCTDDETCYTQTGNSLTSQFDFTLGLVIRP
ncbi:MAG TPA: hypothetical protein VF720_09495 [Candidatus Eisenbacteria bacterium]